MSLLRMTAGPVGLAAAAALLLACKGDEPESPFTEPDDETPEQTGCDRDEDCSDGVFCNGSEICLDDRTCKRGELPDCDDDVECTTDRCDETTAACAHDAPDADLDGHADASCENDEGDALGDDCDDADPGRFPGNSEFCDADHHDEDCNYATFGNEDADGDTHLNANCCNEAPDGTRSCGDDCDDAVAAAYPGNTENCDAIDNDCNGLFDHPIEDVDADGYPTTGCGGNDCDDHNPEIYAGADEICDGRDSDCSSGGRDEPGEVDLDTDGFVIAQCIATASLAAGECDETQRATHPSATEVCNGRDDDCDRLIDEESGDCGRGIRQVVAGYFNSMAVHLDGTVSAWGGNSSGFTNTGATRGIELPLLVRDEREPDGLLHHVGSLGLGPSHACAVHLDGRVSCWGYAADGQLGTGVAADSVHPPADLGLGNVVQIGVGVDHACALDREGKVYCWGDNASGQLGDGTADDSLVPRLVETLSDVVGIAAGAASTCAVLASGRVYCWGANENGEVGDTTFSDRSLPTRVFGIDDAVQIASGTNTVCVVHRDHTVSCWGSNSKGQQGGADLVDAPLPGKVLDASGQPLANVVEVAVTGDSLTGLVPDEEYGTSCARLADGRVFCWGTNAVGQLGLGVLAYYTRQGLPYIGETHFAQYAVLTADPETWTDLEALPPFRAASISGGTAHVCATDELGVVQCWGDGRNFELGADPEYSRPAPIEGLQ